jgi:thioredoxin-dependent peroxiredoxin
LRAPIRHHGSRRAMLSREARRGMMKHFATSGIVLASLVFGSFAASPAFAGLKPGDAAPDFKAEAAVGGKDFTFSLAEALKRGPVVLYFYPKSFTRGCTIEAHEFAEAAGSFAAAGASLIGVSHDDIATQRKFSTEECRDKFPVAADPTAAVIRAYDAQMFGAAGQGMSDRISYVIAPDGKVIYSYSDPAPDKHIENTLAVVRKWHDDHQK